MMEPARQLGEKSARNDKPAEQEQEQEQELVDVATIEKYLRPGIEVDPDMIRNKHLKRELKKSQQKFKEAAVSAARAEILYQEEAGCLEAEGMEKTYRFKQSEIAEHVNLNTSRKIFNLNLDTFGPYTIDYERNGRHMLLAGKKGHIAVMDMLRLDIVREFHTEELIRDVAFLHNYSMFAVAQKKYTYIYDANGAEIHCIRDTREPTHLVFLPYHFLLVTAAKQVLRYQDTSTGHVAVEHRIGKQGRIQSMTQNPWNAVIHLGNAKGVVSLWTPNMKEPVVKMFCHRGSVDAIAIDRSGYYMATAGIDRKVKIFDIRKYQELHSYNMRTPVTCLDISQRGMLAIGRGRDVEVWSGALQAKAAHPYMTQNLCGGATAQQIRFQPFEDVLTVAHSNGMSNMVIPGSGEPNIDSYMANPYENTKQRRETEVKQLLDKLKPEMIVLDPSSIGRVLLHHQDTAATTTTTTAKDDESDAGVEGGGGEDEEKRKGKGKGKDTSVVKLRDKKRGRGKNQVLKKKQHVMLNRQREKAKEHVEEWMQQQQQQCGQATEDSDEPEPARTALSRFVTGKN